MLDLKIVGGQIADGTGRPLYKADVGVIGGMIAAIGDLKDTEGRETIDAAGKVVSPGFIDIHTHSDINMLLDPHAESALRCGVTTQVTGNCGMGVAPLSYPDRKVVKGYIDSQFNIANYVGPSGFCFAEGPDYPWTAFAEYQDYIRAHRPLINMAALIAHGPVRMSVLGLASRPANGEEREKMRGLIREGMEAGAFGLSVGLAYSPGDFTGRDELAEISRAIKPYGGFFTAHIRDQSEGIFDALEEVGYITERAGVPLHISHLKLAGQKMWGRTGEIFRWIDDRNRQGLRTTFDVYPYTVGATNLLRIMPPWVKEGGIGKTIERMKDPPERKKIRYDLAHGLPGWDNLAAATGLENLMLTSFTRERNKEYEGLSIREIGERMGKDPWDAYFDLAIDEECALGMLVASMSEKDMEAIITHPGAIVISDGTAQSFDKGHPYGMEHPRSYGTQAKVLGEFVREKKLLTVEEAVRKMTSMPAELFGMKGRGIIRTGYTADITVFDPETVEDRSTFADLRVAPAGICAVIIDGIPAFRGGRILSRTAGGLVVKD